MTAFGSEKRMLQKINRKEEQIVIGALVISGIIITGVTLATIFG